MTANATRTELRSILAISLLSVGPSSAAAQSVVTVRGTVRNSANGQGMESVHVYIEETGQGATSALDGRWAIARVRPGRYTLVASVLGFQPYREQLTVGANARVDVDITLDGHCTWLHRVQPSRRVSRGQISPQRDAREPVRHGVERSAIRHGIAPAR